MWKPLPGSASRLLPTSCCFWHFCLPATGQTRSSREGSWTGSIVPKNPKACIFLQESMKGIWWDYLQPRGRHFSFLQEFSIPLSSLLLFSSPFPQALSPGLLQVCFTKKQSTSNYGMGLHWHGTPETSASLAKWEEFIKNIHMNPLLKSLSLWLYTVDGLFCLICWSVFQRHKNKQAFFLGLFDVYLQGSTVNLPTCQIKHTLTCTICGWFAHWSSWISRGWLVDSVALKSSEDHHRSRPLWPNLWGVSARWAYPKPRSVTKSWSSYPKHVV